MGTTEFESVYQKQLKDVTTLYVVNLIVCILCIIVLSFFLYKALPVEQQSGLFNQYVGGVIVLFVFIVSCWTLNFFQTIKKQDQDSSVVTTSSIVVVFTLVAIGLYAYRIAEAYGWSPLQALRKKK